MAEFVYNNDKNTDTGYTSFKLNYNYHSCIFYKENIDSSSKSKSFNELTIKFRGFMANRYNNL